MKRPCQPDATDLSKSYAELRQDLTAAGYRFNSTGDTEVILASYMHWGTDCLHRFNGMWSLAIAPAEREFFILGASEANRRMIRQSLFAERRLPFAHAWGVVLEELSHRLLEVAIVLLWILFNIERLGRGATPDQLFGSRVE